MPCRRSRSATGRRPGELWGKIPRRGGNATAQAHVGLLPQDAKPGSLEFFTIVRPKADNRHRPCGLSVTSGLCSASAAERIVEALGIAGARVTQVNADAAS
jgi:hypothetical protein